MNATGGLAALWAGALLLALYLGGIAAPGAAAQSGEKEKIAVLDLEGVGASKTEAAALSERLREALLKTGRFTMVDRSQISKILEEQALQQAGCTGENCVVKVGRILGVRKIVAGKAVKVDEGTWLLSAILVDAETAETLNLVSVRHQGEFLALLDTGMTTLAARLTGKAETGPVPATASRAEPEPAEPPGQPSVKLALFPARVTGQFAPRVRQAHPRLVDGFEKLIGRMQGRISLTHSFYPTTVYPEAHRAFRDRAVLFEEAGKQSWEGFFVKSPNERFIFRAGRELGVDLVLLQALNVDRAGGQVVRQFRVFLLDVNNLKVYHRSGSWEPRRLGRALWEANRAVLIEYRRETARGRN